MIKLKNLLKEEKLNEGVKWYDNWYKATSKLLEAIGWVRALTHAPKVPKIIKKDKKLDKMTNELYKQYDRLEKYVDKMGYHKYNEGKLSEGKIKPKQKISKKEWGKIKKFNKHIGQDGTHYVMQLDKRLGTILVPVIVEGKLSEVNKAQEVLKHITGGSPSRVGNLPNMGNYVYQEKNGITFGLDKPINKVKVVQIVQTKPNNYDVYFKTDAKKVKKKVKNVEGRMLTSVLMKHALKR
mgnify:FL=1